MREGPQAPPPRVIAAAAAFPRVRCGLRTRLTMMIHGFQSSHQDFSFGPWKLTASKTHIMKSADVERCGAGAGAAGPGPQDAASGGSPPPAS